MMKDKSTARVRALSNVRNNMNHRDH